MRLLFFLTLSALLHSLILAFPSPYSGAGNRVAIPFTVILAGQQEMAGSTVQEQPVTRRIRTLPVKSTGPVIRPVRKAPERRSPVTIAAKAVPPLTRQIQTPIQQSEKPKHQPVPPVEQQARLIEEPLDEPLAIPLDRPETAPEPDLPAGHIIEEEPDQVWNRYDVTASLNLQGANSVDTLSPAKGTGGNNPEDGGTQGERMDRSPTVRVQYAHVTKPEYPWRARRMGWEGTTLLRVLVDNHGHSRSVEISRSSGYESLDSAAVKAVKRWRFNPARTHTGPVESWVKIPVVFTLKDSEPGAWSGNR